MKPFGPYLNGYHDVADQLAHYIRRRADVAFAEEAAAKAGLSTAAAFEERRRRLQQVMLDSIGGLPELPATVSARRTGVVDVDDCSIEKLLIESLPGVYVTANLYVPKGASGRRPGVLFVCGHAREAKAYPEYQRVCRSLVSAGLVVLAIDPVGQGERLQYLDPATGEELVGWGTTEHSHAGFQCHVAGFNIARYFVADGIQALTYLASRPEVDPSRLGVTGNSGGGTQSSYLLFLDGRYACGAPCTYITSRESYMATGQAHDSEQNLFRAVAAGLNYDDLVSGLAPKPVMLGAVASDFFCIDGTLQSFERLRHVYELYGRPDDLYLVVSPGTHAYSAILREQVTRFFRRHLLGEEVALESGFTSFAPAIEAPGPCAPPVAVPEQPTLPPAELNVTKPGQVALELPEAKTVFHLNLAAWRSRQASASTSHRPAQAAKELLREQVLADRPRPPLWVREIRTGVENGVRWAHRFGFTEPGIAVPMIELWREDVAPDAPLTVAGVNEGTEAVAVRTDWVGEVVRRTGRVLLFDPRGTGAAAPRPVNPRPVDALYGTFYKLNYDAMMLGDSLFAMRAFDAVRVLEYAHRIAPSVRIEGEGTAGLLLLVAAVIDGKVAGGRFSHLPGSFGDLISDRFFVPDYMLEVYRLADWPDVSQMLAWLPVAHTTAPGQ